MDGADDDQADDATPGARRNIGRNLPARGGARLPARRGEQSRERSDEGLPARRTKHDPTAPIRRRPINPLPDFTGMQPETVLADATYHEFLPAAQRIVVTPPSRWRRILGYAICGVIAAAVLWSFIAHLRLFAIASGEFLTQGGTQVVESREAGQVSKMPVKTGDHVKKGDLVLQLDPTAAQAAKTIIEAKLANARAESVRRGAAVFIAKSPEIDKNAPVAWPSGIPQDVVKREESVLRADLSQLVAIIADLKAKRSAEEATRDKYVANIAAQKVLIDSRTKRTAMHETLAEKGWDSRAIVLQSLEPLRENQVSLTSYEGSLTQSKATIQVLDDQLAQARASFIADNAAAGATADRQVADLVQQLKQATLQLDNLSLRAPAAGVVQALAVTSLGQGVKVGEQLMQIVPDGAPLEIQAYVLNTDIGFVKVGQPVTIKVDTFPFTRYGTISGTVTRIGADAITGALAAAQQKDDTTMAKKGPLSQTLAAQQTNDLVFPVTIKPGQPTINVDGRAVPFTAGMSLVAEIETENQRAIGYILYPLTRVWRHTVEDGSEVTTSQRTETN